MCRFHKLTIICVLICTVTTGTENNRDINNKAEQIEQFVDDDEIHSWDSGDYSQSKFLIITTKKGYSISITIDHLDLDGHNGDFLLIKPGTVLHDDMKGKVFTYNLDYPRKYIIPFDSAYLGFYVLGDNPNKKSGFKLTYQRVGEEITTTTANPTTEQTWPTPAITDSIDHTVYVSGKSQDDFKNKEVINDFKTSLVGMATEYCDSNNFILTENITNANVHLYQVVECPYSWPESNICVKVRFALPVTVAENSLWTGYQLTTPHLEAMWNQLADKYLTKYNMSTYSKPDNSSTLQMWIIISCIVVILFLILLYFIKVVSHHCSPLKSMKRRSSDTSSIIPESRISKMSLGPHPLQVTPPFFDNDYSFQQFEPDVGIPTKNYGYEMPLSEDDSDSDIIFTNFSNSRNNIVPEESNT